MTPREAAKVIGCTKNRVLQIIAEGKLRASKKEIPGGFYYELKRADVERYRDNRPKPGPKTS